MASRRRGRVLLITAVVFWSMAAAGIGKCAAVHYLVGGRVIRAGDSKPVAGAIVTLTVDGRDPDRWLPDDRRPLQVSAEESGSFSIGFSFDTFQGSSFLGGHRCSRRPKIIALSITAPGYAARLLKFTVASLAERDLEVRVAVPENDTALVFGKP